jgi:predicted outer membrane protein
MRTHRRSEADTAAAGLLTGARPVIAALVAAIVVSSWALVDLASARPAYGHDTAVPGPSVPAPGSPTISGQQAEPLTAADRDLLVKVRLAGLWEMPAGNLAARKGVTPRVREIGAMIGAQHRELDALVVQTAKQLGVALPDQPNADQEHWLDEMRAASGEQFDHVFVDRLRAAHGKVFPVIASVRAATRNTAVRRLAQSANGFVLTHLTLLESTGLVEYANLPPAPQPVSAAGSPSAGAGVTGAVRSLVHAPLPFPVIIIALAVLLMVQRILRYVARRRSRSPARRSYRATPRPAPFDPPAALPSPFPSSPVIVHTSRRLRTNSRVRP